MHKPGDDLIRNASRPLLVVVAALVLAGLACGPCGSLSGPVPTPPHYVSLSADLAERLEARLRQVTRGTHGQSFRLSITDSELSSLVSTKLAQYGKASAVQDPIIWFADGKVYGTGRLAHVLPVESDFYVIATASTDEGKIAISIEQARAGTMALPGSVRDMLSRSISETIDELQSDVQVTRLELLQGEAIVEGVHR